MVDTNANPNDPSGFLNPSNQVVKVINTARDDLNGCLATVVSFSEARGRYTIAVPPTNPSPSSPQSQQPSGLSLKPSNLQAASMIEKVKFRGIEARQQAQMLLNDPRARRQFETAYNNLQNRLPRGVKPQHVAYGAVLASILFIYFFGLMKTILAFSILIMPLIVSAPDLLSGANARIVMKNFPARWRQAIVEMTGYTRISNRMAMGLFAVLVIMCGKVLITPNIKPAAHTPPMKTSSFTASSTSSVSENQNKFDEIYKLGYNDAKSNNPYGHSLPSAEEISTSISTEEQHFDELSWENDPNWIPPPPPNSQSKSKFGFTTMMALFTILRTVKDLSFGPDGRFNLQLLIANAKMLDPMRLGFLGLSVYRLVSVFLR